VLEIDPAQLVFAANDLKENPDRVACALFALFMEDLALKAEQSRPNSTSSRGGCCWIELKAARVGPSPPNPFPFRPLRPLCSLW
jgi:hypothetical protein